MGVDPDVALVMNSVDEHKHQIPEGKYIKMCDALKRIHQKLKKPRLQVPTIRFTIADTKYVWWFSSIVTIVKVAGSIKRKFMSTNCI
jgi:hypothetical protein